MPVHLAPLPPSSVGELLTLQRAAYLTEAQLYDDVGLPPLLPPRDESVVCCVTECGSVPENAREPLRAGLELVHPDKALR